MAVTTTFSLTLLGNSVVTTHDGAAVYANGAATVALEDGSFATAVNDYDTSRYPDGQVRLNFSTKSGGYASSFVLDGWDPSVALLSNDRVGIVRTTPDGHIRFQTFDAEVSDPSLDLGIGRNADIAAPQYGTGFVAAWEAPLDNGYSNIVLGIAPGSDGTGFFSFNVKFGATVDRNPSVACLSDGNIVVAWDRTDASGNSAIWYAVYDQSGGVVTAPTLYDGTGSRNTEPSVAAVGSGFSIAYEDNEAFRGVAEIAFFNRSSDGRNVSYHRMAAPDGAENGPDSDASTAQLGYVYATTFTHTELDQGQPREVSVYLSLTDPLTGASLTDPDKPLLVGTNIAQATIAAIPHDDGRVVVSYTDEFDGQVHQQIARVVETIVGDAAGQTLRGSRGVAVSIDGGGGADILTDTQGDDRLFGNTGDDRLRSQDGDYGNYSGNDIYDGGDGIDTLDFSGFFGGVTVNLSITSPQKTDGTGGLDTILRIENLTGSSFAADRLTGNNGNNVLDDGGPNRYGSSVLKDTLIGGLGNDTYIVTDSVDVVIESSASGGTDLVKSRGSFTLSANVENLTLLAEAGGASATGNGLANVITGNGSGNLIDGKGGIDKMIGGAGSDTYTVDNSGDRCIEVDGQGTDSVLASVSYSLVSQFLENLTLTGTGNINATGNSLVNTLKGNTGANVLNGKGGADTMIGGAGSDTYYVDNGGDRCLEADGQGTDSVLASVSYSLASQFLESLTLTGTAAINGTGNSLVNTLKGNTGANVLNGMAGNDTLTGLAGADTFAFSTALGSTNVDRLTDFSHADDTIRLAKSVFTALSGGTLASGAFKDLGVSGAKVDADDRILYNHTTGVLSYDADGSGSKTAVQFATLLNKPTNLAFDDFSIL